MKVDAKEIKTMASGRWEAIAGAIAPGLNEALGRIGRHVACPIHGGSDGFRLYKDFAETGGGACNTCGRFPDGLALLAWATQRSFRDTLVEVAKCLGGQSVTPLKADAPPKRSPEEIAAEDEAIRLKLIDTWKMSIPLTRGSPLLARYLAGRGIAQMPEQEIRLNPRMMWVQKECQGLVRKGPYPVILGRVSDCQGRGVTLHRTYLSSDGSRKADLTPAKKVMARTSTTSMSGGSIKLFKAEEVLGVSEGIETALAVKQATGMPCWSLVSAQFMPSFKPPPGVKHVVIWSDKNRPSPMHPNGHGQEAASELARRLESLGIQATVRIPPFEIPEGCKDLDWLDVLNTYGPEGFALTKEQELVSVF
jgi:putative DNA primase/helicase